MLSTQFLRQKNCLFIQLFIVWYERKYVRDDSRFFNFIRIKIVGNRFAQSNTDLHIKLEKKIGRKK